MSRAIQIMLLVFAAFVLVAAPSGRARAGEVSVKCALRTDEDDAKAGSLRHFPLSTLEGENWERYRESCDFSAAQFLFLRGEINRALENTVKRFYGRVLADDFIRKAMSRNKAPGFIVFLSSAGGSVNAALRLGRFIRKLGASVFVDGECSSACVFVLAAGVKRYVNGPVGVHRPYTLRDGAISPSPEDWQTSFRRRKTAMDYLAEMQVPVSLFELMDRTPPELLHTLNGQEISEYQLDNGKLPTPEESPAAEPRSVADAPDDFHESAGLHDTCCGYYGGACVEADDAVAMVCMHDGTGCSFVREYSPE
ncbi:MAG: hypothetical protein PHY92_08870 [Alphaproteobacteria bacterium]|nr:hypothetical protein [Alphaproteobacteria bacterium]